MDNSMIDFDTSGIFAELEQFKGHIKAPLIRTGSAAAAARVLYEEARRRCPVKTGLLKSSIYRVLSGSESKPGQKSSITCHGMSERRRTAISSNSAPARRRLRPFLRPAYESAKAEAIAAGIEAMRAENPDDG